MFDSGDWLYEIKYDGFRALGYVEKGWCRLISRNGNQFKRFDDLSRSIGKEIKARNAVLDGEVVAIDETGTPAFYELLKKKPACQTAYFAFDLVWLNGRDLRELPLLVRKKLLRSVIPRRSSCVAYVSFVDRQVERLFELVKRNDLEGLVVKRKDGQYRSQTKWYKIMNPSYSQKAGREEFFQ